MATSSRARSMLTGMPRSSRIAAPPNPFVSPAPPPPVEPPQQAYDPKAMAQRVLEMAVRKSPVDMSYDANNDGRITSSDALQVAKGWRPGGGMTGAPQNTPLAGTSPIPQPVYSNPEGPIRKAPIEPPQAGTTNPFSSMALTMGPTFRPQNRLSPAALPSLGIEGLRALLSGQPLPGPGQPPPGLGQPPQGLGQPPQGLGQFPQGLGQPPQGLGQFPQGLGQPPQGLGQFPQGLGQFPQGLGQPLQGFGPQDPMLLDMMYRGPSLTPEQQIAQQQFRMDKERQMAASQTLAMSMMNRGQQPFPMNNQPMPTGPQNPFGSGGSAGMLGVPQQQMQSSALGMTPPGGSQFPLGGGNASAGPMPGSYANYLNTFNESAKRSPFNAFSRQLGGAFATPMSESDFNNRAASSQYSLGMPQQQMPPSSLGMTPPGGSQFPLGGGNAFAGPMTQQPTQTPPQSAFGFGGPTQQAQGSNNQQGSRPGLF